MFRSQSGPGGLSISTTSANALSGQSSLPPLSGTPQTKPLLGSLTSTPQPQQSLNIFGASQNQAGNNQQQQGGGLFGNQATAQATGGGILGSSHIQKSAGSLFGNNPTQQSQPQQTGGPFGPSLGQSLGLNQARPQQQQLGGFLGSLGQSPGQNQAQQPQNNIFGGTSNQNKTLLFTQTQQPSNQQNAPPSIFSSSIGQLTQQQQTVPGVKISVNELRPTTRFNDLHEELQKAIGDVDNFILHQIQLHDECAGEVTDIINDMCETMPTDVDYCRRSLDTMQQALENDAESIAFAKGLAKADVADAKLSFKVIQNLKLPPQFHQTSLWSSATAPRDLGPRFPDDDLEAGGSQNIVEYFSKQADQMFKALDTYKRNIAEVEGYLKGIESNAILQMQQMVFTRGRDGNEKTAEDQVRELAAVLREFESGILGVATHVGATREKVQDVMLSSVDEGRHAMSRGRRFGMS